MNVKQAVMVVLGGAMLTLIIRLVSIIGSLAWAVWG